MQTKEFKEELKAFEDKCAEQEAFYTECGNIIGVEHIYTPPVRRRTRWNNRLLGNGRFKGFGTIQCMGSMIRVMDRAKGTQMFSTYDEVYKYLKGE